ncbi:cytochrome P450 [Ilyonectria robusta]|uniref:cytochrome P450 n=1 Tax=Ilyonectria robusta TaxID=1079257 RepID=UPI001E8D4645|nr:cytochrome P450 [Ilyonectria robusta]KAH8654787.1 cytochrome P450 [Ilyonectria robusta]
MATTLVYGLGAFGLLCLYFVQSIVYNLFFHPFRKFPGPRLARISRICTRHANFQGLRYMKIHQAHEKYGSVVRIGPNELSFANPSAIRDIYMTSNFQKEEAFYFSKRGYEEEHLFSFRNPEAHNQRRKLLLRGYSMQSALGVEQEIATKVQTLLDTFAKEATNTKAVDIYSWVHLLSFDIVYRLLFGEDPKSLESGGEHRVLSYFRAWRPIFIYKEFWPQLEKFGIYLPGGLGNNFRKVKAWKEYSVDLIQKSRQNAVVTSFFHSVLYGEKDGYLGRPLTDSEVAEECMSGMFGGTGTTANTFLFLLWATLNQEEVVSKLKSELKSAFPTPKSVPDYQTCSRLPYLQAVINETLRVYPTIVAMIPRIAMRDSVVAGVPIPKGTVVGIQNYTVHRWESAFPNPEHFNPDRWLDDKHADQRKEAFVPFSVGARRCIGMKSALDYA